MFNFIKNKDKILNLLHISGFVLLFVITCFGIYQIREENLTDIKNLIINRWRLFLFACSLRLLDWILDYYLWRCMLKKYSANVPIMKSVWIYLSSGAGIILPAQLGRALRGYIITKTTDISLSKAMSLEFLFLLCVFEGAFLIIIMSLGFYANTFLLPIILSLLILIMFPLFIKMSKPLLSKFKISLADDLSHPLFLIIFCIGCSIGWAVNGLIFYLLLGGKESGIYLTQAEMIVLGNLFLAICSGIPGGIGIVETTMSISLHWLKVQLPEIILVIGLFRIITFWIWIPVGWLALFRLKLYKKIHLEESIQ
ncbi:MAG: lysylphosphatidylglycerol synthase domain-containing protein [Candidatus Hydrogenedens sp.]